MLMIQALGLFQVGGMKGKGFLLREVHKQRIRGAELLEHLGREDRCSGDFEDQNLCEEFPFTLATETRLSVL